MIGPEGSGADPQGCSKRVQVFSSIRDAVSGSNISLRLKLSLIRSERGIKGIGGVGSTSERP